MYIIIKYTHKIYIASIFHVSPVFITMVTGAIKARYIGFNYMYVQLYFSVYTWQVIFLTAWI